MINLKEIDRKMALRGITPELHNTNPVEYHKRIQKFFKHYMMENFLYALRLARQNFGFLYFNHHTNKWFTMYGTGNRDVVEDDKMECIYKFQP